MYSGFNADVDGIMDEEKKGRQSALGYNRAAEEPGQMNRGPSADEAMAELASMQAPQAKQVDFSSMLNSLRSQREADQSRTEADLAQNDELLRKTTMIDAALEGLRGTSDIFGAKAGKYAIKRQPTTPVSQIAQDRRKQLLEAALLRRKGIDQAGEDELKAGQYQQNAYNSEAQTQQRSIDDRRQALMAIAAQRRFEDKLVADTSKAKTLAELAQERIDNEKRRIDLRRRGVGGESGAPKPPKTVTPNKQAEIEKVFDDRLERLGKAITPEYVEAASIAKTAGDLFGLEGNAPIEGVSGLTDKLTGGAREYLPEAIGGLTEQAKKNKALFQQLMNIDLKKMSGGAVSDSEQKRFEVAKGMVGSRNPAVMRQGVKLMQQTIRAVMQQREAGFPDEVRRVFKERGGMLSGDFDNKPAAGAKTRMVSPDGKMYEVTNVDAALAKGWKVAP